MQRHTYERNRKRQLPLVPPRQLACQPVRIHVKRRRIHEALYIMLELLPAVQTLQPPVYEQVLADGQLRVNGGELWADSKRQSCRAWVVHDGDSVDEHVSVVGDYIAAFTLERQSVYGHGHE